ncbi:uncharacterized protein LOC144110296 isoform X1 [Amblyomma americanum]
MYRSFVDATSQAGHRISFTLNADGSPVFKSSGTSIRPIQLMINELPPSKRMKNLVLAGLWFGKDKPHMGIFQGAFVEVMNKLSQEGFDLNYEGRKQNFKAFCTCCAVDSVARAPMQGVTQFNGYHGCNWCLQKGERVGRATKYPVEDKDSAERSEEQMVSDMETAIVEGRPVNGVKSFSPLINMQQFNIVWSFVPDYMHCMLLGMGRQFLDLWFESPGSSFYLGRSQAAIDKRLMTIAPPRDEKRTPRPTKERRWWKAKEFENWLLFYSVPALGGILSSQYLQHWACLVEAVHIMLEPKVSFPDLTLAETLLLDFCAHAQILYGKECMTYNMHQLLHIGKSVRHWGPLWAHSAFPFEAGNGTLKEAVKAANGIPHQVCRVLQIEGVVEKCIKITTHQGAIQYCASLDTASTQKSVSISGGLRFFGRGRPYVPSGSTTNKELVAENSIEYPRLFQCGRIFTGEGYARNKKTNNSLVQLPDGSFAVIVRIVSSGQIFAVVQPLKSRVLKYNTVEMKHLYKVISFS